MEKNKGLIKTLKDLFSSNDKAGKIQFLVLLILIGVLLVVFTNTLVNPQEPVEDVFSKKSADTVTDISFTDSDLNNLEAILSEVKGVGKVKVMITYKNSGTNVYAKDVNQTVDSEEQKSGDGKTVTRKNEDIESSVVFTGQKVPIIEDKMTADVKGVLVVAQGADDPVVRTQILHAVQVLTGVEVHNIAVCTYR
ncbi:MAG TPA: hypothetical protein DDZ89_18650 [Clostridiales bacterium]|nr:hypothetical protein [Clostridiales bacterium]